MSILKPAQIVGTPRVLLFAAANGDAAAQIHVLLAAVLIPTVNSYCKAFATQLQNASIRAS